jgi:hypothetical protein
MKPAEAFRALLIAAALLAAQFECVRTSTVSGGGTDVSNAKVRGSVVHADGTPAVHARVAIIAASYDALRDGAIADSLIDTTDASGNYAFAKVDSGAYNVQALSSYDNTSALAVGIHVVGDSVEIPEDTLRAPGAIKVMLPDNLDAVNGYVYVPGTMISARLNGSASYVLLDSVPAGKIPPVYYSAINDGPARSLSDTLRVPSAATMTIISYAFRYSKKLILNTNSNGANIYGNVYNFPVLIRLSKNNFNFAEAQANGNDIRFIKPDNTSLPYEIERWDAARGQAELWVKVDTVYGNDSVQSINMYWGNSGAIGVSNSPAVFDTANGFAAVWHLDQNCADAGYNKHDGITGSRDTIGIIGYSKKFSGADSIKIPGLLGSPSSVTLSAWAQLDTMGTQGSEVISIGDAVLIRMDDYRPNYGVMGAMHLSTLPNDTVHYNITSGRKLQKTGWHFLALSVDATNFVQSLYIDGNLCGLGNSKISIIDYTGVGQNTFIGKHGNGKNLYNFTGRIDEVRVSKTVLSDDWIKLCYMNQKAEDLLMKFK